MAKAALSEKQMAAIMQGMLLLIAVVVVIGLPIMMVAILQLYQLNAILFVLTLILMAGFMKA